MQELKYISDFFLQIFNFNFDICTSVGSWLDKITHLLFPHLNPSHDEKLFRYKGIEILSLVRN